MTQQTDQRPAQETLMTESDREPLVSYVLATYNRKDELRDAVDSIISQEYSRIEVVVISNADDGTEELFSDGGRFDRESVNFNHFDGRMGVPQARNIGYRRANGEIIVTIDDDAVLRDADATSEIVRLFDQHDDAGVLAFQSRNYYTGELVRREIPDPPIASDRSPEEGYEATFFVGVGNAIRRSVFEEAGYYPGDFVYGFEEMDFSLRILDAGYKIRYAPSVVVEHKKSPAGRSESHETLQRELENRVKIMIRNLPWRYVLFSTLLWSGYTAVRADFDLGPVVETVRRIVESRDQLLEERSPINRGTIEYVKSMGGIFLWWYGPHPARFLESDVGLERLTW